MNRDTPTETAGGSQQPQTPRPTIPDFDLVRPLGRGGFGQVWLARSRSGVYRAVKVLPKSELTDVEMAGLRSYETHARRHPHLIDVRHVGETDFTFYYVMELADGYSTAPTFDAADYEPRTLQSDLKRRGHLPLDEAVTICRQVLDGLSHLHEHGLLHRDVKPGNIMFVEGVAKLGDIGLVARDAHKKVDAQTPAYAPPEGVQDRSGDLYCLGKMLFEMVAGTSPVNFPELRETADAARVEAFRRIVPVIDKACDPAPAGRFQSAAEFERALNQGAAAAKASAASSLFRAADSGSKRAFLVVISLAAVVAGLFGIPHVMRSPNSASTSRGAQIAQSHGRLTILYKEASDSPEHFALSEATVPLRTGDLIKTQVDLDVPLYPVLALVSAAEGVQIAYPLDLDNQKAMQSGMIPIGNEWWRLSPPEGTLAFVLLASDRPIRDTGKIREKLAAMKDVPVTDRDTILTLVDGTVTPLHGRQGRTRGVTDVTQTVTSEPGLLNRLDEAFGDDFPVVAAVAVRQEPAQAGS